MSSQPSLSCVKQPMKVYIRAFEALKRLRGHFEAWCLLELSTFLDWWKDVHTGDTFQPSLCAPTCSTIFEDKHLYADHVHWSVVAYILAPKSTFVLNLTREVVLAPHKLCSTQPMSLQPLFHSLHQWYYPPLMDDVMANLETAAHGYLEHLDTFRPMKGFKCTLDKIENKKNDKARHMAKKARMSTISQIPQLESVELRCLTNAGAAPEWFPKAQDVWIHAMSHVSHLELASSTSPCQFYFPPIHLFWGGNKENQQIYYYHFLILHHKIWEWPMHNLLPLTTSEWRSILGNSYWKRQLPNQDSPSPDETSTPKCSGKVKEMEHIQFPATFEKQWKGQEMFIYMIVEMWDTAGGGTNFKFFDNKKVWRNWLWVVCEVAMGWDGFDSWDWGTGYRFGCVQVRPAAHVLVIIQLTLQLLPNSMLRPTSHMSQKSHNQPPPYAKPYHNVLRLRACLSLLMGALTTNLALHIKGYPKAKFAGIFCRNTLSPPSSSHSWSSSLHLEKCLVKQKIDKHEITLQVLKEQMSNIEESITSTTFMDHIATSIFLLESPSLEMLGQDDRTSQNSCDETFFEENKVVSG
ncbi:hypothetical protein H4582DRAFT_2053995 [Lactarius indigo]|nr:hypothetical protein H4582DRAFT_2053995 [Lactarius indigo]